MKIKYSKTFKNDLFLAWNIPNLCKVKTKIHVSYSYFICTLLVLLKERGEERERRDDEEKGMSGELHKVRAATPGYYKE